MMSYPRDLDEYREDELREELRRREAAQQSGVCDYCGRPPNTKSCKFVTRHNMPAIVLQHHIGRVDFSRGEDGY